MDIVLIEVILMNIKKRRSAPNANFFSIHDYTNFLL